MVSGRSGRLGWRGFDDPWVRFSALFALLVIISEVIYYGVLLDSGPMAAYLAWTARLSGQVLAAIGVEVAVQGNNIGGGGFAVQISPECDAIQLCAVLLAAIVSFGAPLRSKLVGMVLGVAWLEAVNIARIVSLYLLGAARPGFFQTAHEMVWPVVLIAITLATWIFWARRAVRGEPQPA